MSLDLDFPSLASEFFPTKLWLNNTPLCFACYRGAEDVFLRFMLVLETVSNEAISAAPHLLFQ